MKACEAVHILRMIQGECEKQHMDGEAEALQMGIEALSAQPEPTLEQIEEYCHKRCLVLITADLYGKLTHHSFKTATAQPERKKDIIQTFNDYQIEWLTNHYDLALEPQLGELIVRFLHDTANMYMLEMERRTDETD